MQKPKSKRRRKMAPPATNKAYRNLLAIWKDKHRRKDRARLLALKPHVQTTPPAWSLSGELQLETLPLTPALVPSLLQFLQKELSWGQQAAIIRFLGRLGDPRATSSLLQMLDYADAKLRQEIIKALGQIGDSTALGPLCARLAEEQGHTLVQLVATLANDFPQARQALAERVKAVQYQEALWLGQALPLIHNRAIFSILLQAALLYPSTPMLRELQRAFECRQAWFLAELLQALQANQPKVKTQAADFLQSLEAPTLVAALVALFPQARAVVRTQIIAQLQMQPARYSVPALLKLLPLTRDDMRPAVIWALARLKAREAIEHLVALLAEDSFKVRQQASLALAEFGVSAKEAVLQALGHADARVRVGAASTLGFIGSPECVPDLIKRLADDDPQVRAMAAMALTDIGKPASMELRVALHFSDARIRAGAARTLGFLKEAEAATELVALLADEEPQVRETASWALHMIGAPALAVLEQHQDDLPEHKAAGVRRLLAQIKPE